MLKTHKLNLVIAIVVGLFVFIRSALAGHLAVVQVPVNLTVEKYAYINIHKDELAMKTIRGSNITGADIGTQRWVGAFSLVDVLSNCPTTLRCARSITLTNPEDGTLSVGAIAWLGLFYGHASYRFDEDYEYIDLERGDYTNGLRLVVSITDYTWSYDDKAGTYTGTITLDIYAR